MLDDLASVLPLIGGEDALAKLLRERGWTVLPPPLERFDHALWAVYTDVLNKWMRAFKAGETPRADKLSAVVTALNDEYPEAITRLKSHYGIG